MFAASTVVGHAKEALPIQVVTCRCFIYNYWWWSVCNLADVLYLVKIRVNQLVLPPADFVAMHERKKPSGWLGNRSQQCSRPISSNPGRIYCIEQNVLRRYGPWHSSHIARAGITLRQFLFNLDHWELNSFISPLLPQCSLFDCNDTTTSDSFFAKLQNMFLS